MLDWLGLSLTIDDAIAYAIIAAFILLPILGILRMILWPAPLVAAASGIGGDGVEEHARRRSCETGDGSGSCGDGGGDGGDGD